MLMHLKLYETSPVLCSIVLVESDLGLWCSLMVDICLCLIIFLDLSKVISIDFGLSVAYLYLTCYFVHFKKGYHLKQPNFCLINKNPNETKESLSPSYITWTYGIITIMYNNVNLWSLRNIFWSIITQHRDSGRNKNPREQIALSFCQQK